MAKHIDVAIIGAGPYGLSLAAHLGAAGVEYRIFGRPMDLWQHHMPEGMLLKSDGFASNLATPGNAFPLSAFCRERGLAYDDVAIPVQLQTFVDYGLEFQRRFVPDLESKLVTCLGRGPEGFRVTLEDDSEVIARRVVLAIGVGHFKHFPKELSDIGPEFV